MVNTVDQRQMEKVIETVPWRRLYVLWRWSQIIPANEMDIVNMMYSSEGMDKLTGVRRSTGQPWTDERVWAYWSFISNCETDQFVLGDFRCKLCKGKPVDQTIGFFIRSCKHATKGKF